MYVALGTTSDAFKGSTGVTGDGGWTNCLLCLELTDEYVERDDCARLCERTLAERGPSRTGDSGRSVWAVFVLSLESLRLPGCGRAPLGRATRLFRRSNR